MWLFQLEAFMKMRIYELSTDAQFNMFSSIQDLPIESIESITSLLDLVQLSLGEMTEKKLNHLHNVKHSPRYYNYLILF